MYEFWAILRKVKDGDTYVWDVDQGFNHWYHKMDLRLGGVSLRETWMEGGPEAREYLKTQLPLGTKKKIRSIKLDHDPADDMSFNRYVCYVIMDDGHYLHEQLIAEGWAAPWDGRKKPTPYPPWPRIAL